MKEYCFFHYLTVTNKKNIEIELPTKERLDWNQSPVSTHADANWVI